MASVSPVRQPAFLDVNQVRSPVVKPRAGKVRCVCGKPDAVCAAMDVGRKGAGLSLPRDPEHRLALLEELGTVFDPQPGSKRSRETMQKPAVSNYKISVNHFEEHELARVKSGRSAGGLTLRKAADGSVLSKPIDLVPEKVAAFKAARGEQRQARKRARLLREANEEAADAAGMSSVDMIAALREELAVFEAQRAQHIADIQRLEAT